MRTAAKQGELPFDMPDDVVTMCRSEHEAVQTCLRWAEVKHGLDQEAVARLCGWKSPSYLSEIKAGAKRMPGKRAHRFAIATRCNLLEQYRERQEAQRRAKGELTQKDRVWLLVERAQMAELRAAA